MTVTIATSAHERAARRGNHPFECGGALIRAYYRRLATVVGVRGGIDAANVDRVSEHVRRLICLQSPLVLDLSGVNSFAEEATSLLYEVEEDCRAAGVEWTLVAGPAVIESLREHGGEVTSPIAHSVPDALSTFADLTARRRRALLPLIKKTA